MKELLYRSAEFVVYLVMYTFLGVVVTFLYCIKMVFWEGREEAHRWEEEE